MDMLVTWTWYQYLRGVDYTTKENPSVPSDNPQVEPKTTSFVFRRFGADMLDDEVEFNLIDAFAFFVKRNDLHLALALEDAFGFELSLGEDPYPMLPFGKQKLDYEAKEY